MLQLGDFASASVISKSTALSVFCTLSQDLLKADYHLKSGKHTVGPKPTILLTGLYRGVLLYSFTAEHLSQLVLQSQIFGVLQTA